MGQDKGSSLAPAQGGGLAWERKIKQPGASEEVNVNPVDSPYNRYDEEMLYKMYKLDNFYITESFVEVL